MTLNNMNYEVIGSSSKGNCIILEDILMLDCGVAYSRLREYLKSVKLIFISHEHKDHLFPTSIKQIIYNYPTIRFVTSSIDVIAKLSQCGVPKKNIYYLKPDKWYSLGIIKLKTHNLMHDADNYCLKWEYQSKKGIYITDTSNVDNINAKNYDLYLIESNYNQEVLKEHIENCSDVNELYYLNRVPETHLSFEQANSFLIENMGANSSFEYIHKSIYNFKEE